MNDRQVTTGLNAVDAAPSPAQIATNVALKFVWRDVFDLHDRLQQDWLALPEAILHGKDRGHFERQLVGIDFVETSVNDIYLNIDDGITAEDAVEHCFLDALLDRWNVFAGNNAADDFVFDDEAFAAIGGPHVNFDVSILTTAA